MSTLREMADEYAETAERLRETIGTVRKTHGNGRLLAMLNDMRLECRRTAEYLARYYDHDEKRYHEHYNPTGMHEETERISPASPCGANLRTNRTRLSCISLYGFPDAGASHKEGTQVLGIRRYGKRYRF